MRGKFRWLCAIGCVALTVAGCSSNNSTADGPDSVAPTKEQDATIFDKIVDGEYIGDEISLYDISDMVWDENSSLLSVCAYKENYIIALYSGDEQSKVVTYDISDGDVYKKIEFEELLSDEAYVAVSGGGLPYVYDESVGVFYTLNIKNEKYTSYVLDFVPDDMVVSDSGNRIYYTLKDDVRIYQYITETEQSSVAYDALGQVDSIALESVDSDDSTMIVKILTDDYDGYAKISIEMQQLDRLNDFHGVMYHMEGKYLYGMADYPESVCIYDELKPRTFLKFELEEAEELDNMYVYPEGPYIFTMTESANAHVLRFYNIAGGIMENQVELPEDYAITGVSYMEDIRSMCIETVNKDGVAGAVIWDVEAISNIIS